MAPSQLPNQGNIAYLTFQTLLSRVDDVGGEVTDLRVHNNRVSIQPLLDGVQHRSQQVIVDSVVVGRRVTGGVEVLPDDYVSTGDVILSFCRDGTLCTVTIQDYVLDTDRLEDDADNE